VVIGSVRAGASAALFTTEPIVATAAIMLALSISFPLALLFERSCGSIWPGAVIHFVIQGSIKLIDLPAADLQATAVAWIVLSGTLPRLLFVFLHPVRTSAGLRYDQISKEGSETRGKN
jgi:uncharacterized membrane protein